MDRAAIATLVALCGCNHAAGASPSSLSQSSPPLVVAPASAPRVRVLMFNVNFGVADAVANLEAIESMNADVVLLQETTADSEDRYREAFSDRYPNILWQDCCNAGGLGVLSKYPIVWDEYLEPDAGWFPAWLVAVETPIGEVQFLADKGMRSTLAQVDSKADTWHWPLKVGELSSMLDHIVYDARLSLLRAEVQELGRSDHYPVVAEFALAP